MTESVSGSRAILSAHSLQAKSEKNLVIKSTQESIRAVATVCSMLITNNSLFFDRIM